MHPMRFGCEQPDCGERKIRHTFACRAMFQTATTHSTKKYERMDGIQRNLSRMRWVFRSKFKLCESK